MIIRPLSHADVSACARLMAASALWQRYGVTEESAARRFQFGLEGQAAIAVAEVEGQAAGFIWYVTRGVFQRSGYIMLVGVQENQRSRGIGQALLDFAEAEMFREVDDVFLLVSDFNEAAQRFYQRQGYAQVGMIPDYVIQGVAEQLYHKRKPEARPE
jgi:ribosomal protein S18 acetylase RimI-like enzyme